jgi:hypothetical protein
MAKPPRRDPEIPERHSEERLRDSVIEDHSFLQFLLKRAKEYGLPNNRMSDQRSSYVIGSAALANNDLTRSSIVEIDSTSGEVSQTATVSIDAKRRPGSPANVG